MPSTSSADYGYAPRRVRRTRKTTVIPEYASNEAVEINKNQESSLFDQGRRQLCIDEARLLERGNMISLLNQFSEGFARELDLDGILEPEPTNPHDANAVVLKVRGYTIK